MDYAYDGLSQYNQYTLQRLQDSAARRILKVPLLTPSIDTHQQLNMERLDRRRFKHMSSMLYKILHDLAPNKLKQRFVNVSEVNICSTRSSNQNDLYIRKPRLEMTKRAFYLLEQSTSRC